MKFINLIFLMITSSILLASCARQISSDVYAAPQVGEVSTTYNGIVKSVRAISIEPNEQLGDNALGIVGGGVAGGVLGNAVGRGHLLPTAAGAIAGAIGGSLLEKKIKTQSALEYVVQLDNGQIVSVVQGLDSQFQVDQPVYVIMSQSGRSRIIPQ